MQVPSYLFTRTERLHHEPRCNHKRHPITNDGKIESITEGEESYSNNMAANRHRKGHAMHWKESGTSNKKGNKSSEAPGTKRKQSCNGEIKTSCTRGPTFHTLKFGYDRFKKTRKRRSGSSLEPPEKRLHEVPVYYFYKTPGLENLVTVRGALRLTRSNSATSRFKKTAFTEAHVAHLM